jgi:hypothetical protein
MAAKGKMAVSQAQMSLKALCAKISPTGCLEHFHFYSAQESAAKCVFSWGKAASRLVALYTPEVKML